MNVRLVQFNLGPGARHRGSDRQSRGTRHPGATGVVHLPEQGNKSGNLEGWRARGNAGLTCPFHPHSMRWELLFEQRDRQGGGFFGRSLRYCHYAAYS